MVEKIITDPEICDDWWASSGMNKFSRNTEAYPTNIAEDVVVIEISLIEPVQRSPGVRPFDRERMLNILQGFVQQSEILPISVREKNRQGVYRFEVDNGFHRYYASIAAGFSKIPTIAIK